MTIPRSAAASKNSLVRFSQIILIAAIAAGFTLVSVPDAKADDFGTCSSTTGCRADDANMDYCTPYPWPVADWGTPFGDAMANLDAQTDMYRTYANPCGPQTDIGGYLNTSPERPDGLGSTTRGVWICTKKVAGKPTTCDQGSMVINTSLLPNYAQRRKTMCHEIGHAAGLTHTSTYGGCMVSGSSTNITYSSHHVAHINAAY